MAILKLKDGVKIGGLQPEILFGVITATSIATDLKLTELVITACRDGVHKENSLHYIGQAVDIRTNMMNGLTRIAFIARLKEALDSQFDIVDEAVGTSSQHCHLEFDPGNANH